MGWRDGEIEIKTPEQLALMRVAGLVVAEGLAAVREAAVPGATTADLDAVAREVLREAGATSSFLGYGHPPFPAAICASVNDEVVARLLNRASLEGRADDTEDVIRRRLEVYAEQTHPLTDLYGARGVLVQVDGMGGVDEVTARVLAALPREAA